MFLQHRELNAHGFLSLGKGMAVRDTGDSQQRGKEGQGSTLGSTSCPYPPPRPADGHLCGSMVSCLQLPGALWNGGHWSLVKDGERLDSRCQNTD